MSGSSSRRNSSSFVDQDPSSSPTSRSSISLAKSSRKINPVRRCQSMRTPNFLNLNSNSYNLKNRRVSSTSLSLEEEKSPNENHFVKYYQYKINKPNPVSVVDIVIIDNIDDCDKDENKCQVFVLGAPRCGKSSLIQQFHNFVNEQQNNLINNPHLNNKSKPKLLISFKEVTSLDDFYPYSFLTIYRPNAYVVMYAVNDRESFEEAKKLILEIYKWDDAETKPIILVANKTDIVRSRVISKQEGRELAVSHSCKYIETSCAISHNVDFLLAGIGAQINLMNIKQSKIHRKRSIFKGLLKKVSINKSKSCDNLQVL